MRGGTSQLHWQIRKLFEVFEDRNKYYFVMELLSGITLFKEIQARRKKSELDFKGRNSQNKMIVFPKKKGYKPGDYVMVKVNEASSATLLGEIID